MDDTMIDQQIAAVAKMISQPVKAVCMVDHESRTQQIKNMQEFLLEPAMTYIASKELFMFYRSEDVESIQPEPHAVEILTKHLQARQLAEEEYNEKKAEQTQARSDVVTALSLFNADPLLVTVSKLEAMKSYLSSLVQKSDNKTEITTQLTAVISENGCGEIEEVLSTLGDFVTVIELKDGLDADMWNAAIDSIITTVSEVLDACRVVKNESGEISQLQEELDSASGEVKRLEKETGKLWLDKIALEPTQSTDDDSSVILISSSKYQKYEIPQFLFDTYFELESIDTVRIKEDMRILKVVPAQLEDLYAHKEVSKVKKVRLLNGKRLNEVPLSEIYKPSQNLLQLDKCDIELSYAMSESSSTRKSTTRVLSEKTKSLFGGVDVKLSMSKSIQADDEFMQMFKA